MWMLTSLVNPYQRKYLTHFNPNSKSRHTRNKIQKVMSKEINGPIRAKLSEIDPESSVNVRKTGVADNVKDIKQSIEKNGYLPEFPVVLRPHPKKDSEYKYENVSGQCRTESARELGFEDIPAIIVELNDDDAKKRSFMENVNRSELPIKDSIECVEPKWKEFRKQRMTKTESVKKTAEFWGISEGKVRQIIVLGDASDRIIEMVDDEKIPLGIATDIVKSVNPADPESEKIMNERADWYRSKEKSEKGDAKKVLKEIETKDSIEEVEKAFTELDDQKSISFDMSSKYIESLERYGKSRGIDGASAVAKNIVMETLNKD